MSKQRCLRGQSFEKVQKTWNQAKTKKKMQWKQFMAVALPKKKNNIGKINIIENKRKNLDI